MTDEISAELDALSAQFTDRDFDELESRLRIRAASLGWTGDPMKQPPEVVLAESRAVIRDRQAAMPGQND